MQYWLIDWACEYCGFADTTIAEGVDYIQCPMCGEPVVPTFADGRVRPATTEEVRRSRRQ